jgi:hypothetical protein
MQVSGKHISEIDERRFLVGNLERGMVLERNLISFLIRKSRNAQKENFPG